MSTRGVNFAEITASGTLFSHMVGREFESRHGHTKDHHKNGANYLPALHKCIRVGVGQCNPIRLKGRVVCGTVYGEIHLKDLLESVARVEY